MFCLKKSWFFSRLFIFFTVFCVLGLSVATQPFFPQVYAQEEVEVAKKVGLVLFVKGKAYIEDAQGKQRDVKMKTPIFNGDHIKTKKKSLIQVNFIDGSMVRLAGDGDMSVDRYLQRADGTADADVKVKKGKFAVLVKKVSDVAKQDYKIQTTTATIGIRGTFGNGAVTPDSTSFSLVPERIDGKLVHSQAIITQTSTGKSMSIASDSESSNNQVSISPQKIEAKAAPINTESLSRDLGLPISKDGSINTADAVGGELSEGFSVETQEEEPKEDSQEDAQEESEEDSPEDETEEEAQEEEVEEDSQEDPSEEDSPEDEGDQDTEEDPQDSQEQDKEESKEEAPQEESVEEESPKEEMEEQEAVEEEVEDQEAPMEEESKDEQAEQKKDAKKEPKEKDTVNEDTMEQEDSQGVAEEEGAEDKSKKADKEEDASEEKSAHSESEKDEKETLEAKEDNHKEKDDKKEKKLAKKQERQERKEAKKQERQERKEARKQERLAKKQEQRSVAPMETASEKEVEAEGGGFFSFFGFGEEEKTTEATPSVEAEGVSQALMDAPMEDLASEGMKELGVDLEGGYEFVVEDLEVDGVSLGDLVEASQDDAEDFSGEDADDFEEGADLDDDGAKNPGKGKGLFKDSPASENSMSKSETLADPTGNLGADAVESVTPSVPQLPNVSDIVDLSNDETVLGEVQGNPQEDFMNHYISTLLEEDLGDGEYSEGSLGEILSRARQDFGVEFGNIISSQGLNDNAENAHIEEEMWRGFETIFLEEIIKDYFDDVEDLSEEVSQGYFILDDLDDLEEGLQESIPNKVQEFLSQQFGFAYNYYANEHVFSDPSAGVNDTEMDYSDHSLGISSFNFFDFVQEEVDLSQEMQNAENPMQGRYINNQESISLGSVPVMEALKGSLRILKRQGGLKAVEDMAALQIAFGALEGQIVQLEQNLSGDWKSMSQTDFEAIQELAFGVRQELEKSLTHFSNVNDPDAIFLRGILDEHFVELREDHPFQYYVGLGEDALEDVEDEYEDLEDEIEDLQDKIEQRVSSAHGSTPAQISLRHKNQLVHRLEDLRDQIEDAYDALSPEDPIMQPLEGFLQDYDLDAMIHILEDSIQGNGNNSHIVSGDEFLVYNVAQKLDEMKEFAFDEVLSLLSQDIEDMEENYEHMGRTFEDLESHVLSQEALSSHLDSAALTFGGGYHISFRLPDHAILGKDIVSFGSKLNKTHAALQRVTQRGIDSQDFDPMALLRLERAIQRLEQSYYALDVDLASSHPLKASEGSGISAWDRVGEFFVHAQGDLGLFISDPWNFDAGASQLLEDDLKDFSDLLEESFLSPESGLYASLGVADPNHPMSAGLVQREDFYILSGKQSQMDVSSGVSQELMISEVAYVGNRLEDDKVQALTGVKAFRSSFQSMDRNTPAFRSALLAFEEGHEPISMGMRAVVDFGDSNQAPKGFALFSMIHGDDFEPSYNNSEMQGTYPPEFEENHHYREKLLMGERAQEIFFEDPRSILVYGFDENTSGMPSSVMQMRGLMDERGDYGQVLSTGLTPYVADLSVNPIDLYGSQDGSRIDGVGVYGHGSLSHSQLIGAAFYDPHFSLVDSHADQGHDNTPLNPSVGDYPHYHYKGFLGGIKIDVDSSSQVVTNWSAVQSSSFKLAPGFVSSGQGGIFVGGMSDNNRFNLQGSATNFEIGEDLNDFSVVVDRENIVSTIRDDAQNRGTIVAMELPQFTVENAHGGYEIKKPNDVIWGMWDMDTSNPDIYYPGMHNFFVTGIPTSSYDYSSAVSTWISDGTPIGRYSAMMGMTLALGDDQGGVDIFSDGGMGEFLMDFENDTFKSMTFLPNGYLLLGKGSLVDMTHSGGTVKGFDTSSSKESWSIVSLNGEDGSHLFQMSLGIDQSGFSGMFAGLDQPESIIFAGTKEDPSGGSGQKDSVSVAGVGALQRVEEKKEDPDLQLFMVGAEEQGALTSSANILEVQEVFVNLASDTLVNSQVIEGINSPTLDQGEVSDHAFVEVRETFIDLFSADEASSSASPAVSDGSFVDVGEVLGSSGSIVDTAPIDGFFFSATSNAGSSSPGSGYLSGPFSWLFGSETPAEGAVNPYGRIYTLLGGDKVDGRSFSTYLTQVSRQDALAIKLSDERLTLPGNTGQVKAAHVILETDTPILNILEGLEVHYSLDVSGLLKDGSALSIGDEIPFFIRLFAQSGDQEFIIELEKKTVITASRMQSYSFYASDDPGNSITKSSDKAYVYAFDFESDGATFDQWESARSQAVSQSRTLEDWLLDPAFSSDLSQAVIDSAQLVIGGEDGIEGELYLGDIEITNTLHADEIWALQQDFMTQTPQLTLDNSLYLDKNHFYIAPMTQSEANRILPVIEDMEPVLGSGFLVGVPGAEEFEHLVFGLWKSQYQGITTPSHLIEMAGFFSGGISSQAYTEKDHERYKEYLESVGATQDMIYHGQAMGAIYGANRSGQVEMGSAELRVNMLSGTTQGQIHLMQDRIDLQLGHIQKMGASMGFKGAAELILDQANATGSSSLGSYQGRFYGKYDPLMQNAAQEASGSFDAANGANDHRAVGVFGVRK